MAKTPVFVFDLGAVLIDWNPRHLYRKLFDDEGEMERFLSEICTPAWNVEQDRGRTWADAVAELSAAHPAHHDLIHAYQDRWDEMLAGPIDDSVAILNELKADGHELHALTNWSAETFPVARERYEFLGQFETILVSGEEGMIKPDAEIFELLLGRIGRQASECLFIDDSGKNIEAASRLGFDTVLFQGPDRLKEALSDRGL
ncbi:MAG: HAD family hydrolase [Geminicoccaceae bacterium]